MSDKSLTFLVPITLHVRNQHFEQSWHLGCDKNVSHSFFVFVFVFIFIFFCLSLSFSTLFLGESLFPTTWWKLRSPYDFSVHS